MPGLMEYNLLIADARDAGMEPDPAYAVDRFLATECGVVFQTGIDGSTRLEGFTRDVHERAKFWIFEYASKKRREERKQKAMEEIAEREEVEAEADPRTTGVTTAEDPATAGSDATESPAATTTGSTECDQENGDVPCWKCTYFPEEKPVPKESIREQMLRIARMHRVDEGTGEVTESRWLKRLRELDPEWDIPELPEKPTKEEIALAQDRLNTIARVVVEKRQRTARQRENMEADWKPTEESADFFERLSEPIAVALRPHKLHGDKKSFKTLDGTVSWTKTGGGWEIDKDMVMAKLKNMDPEQLSALCRSEGWVKVGIIVDWKLLELALNSRGRKGVGMPGCIEKPSFEYGKYEIKAKATKADKKAKEKIGCEEQQ